MKKNEKRAYVIASLKGKAEHGAAYETISKILQSNGYEVWDDFNHMSWEETQEKTEEEMKKYYVEVQRKIRKADIFVAEISKASSSVGYEIGYAVANSKPTLLLRHEEAPGGLGVSFRGNSAKVVTILDYDLENLDRQIEKFLKKVDKGIFVKRLPVDFTQEQVDFIEKIRKNSKEKKSFNAVVRDLIDRNIN